MVRHFLQDFAIDQQAGIDEHVEGVIDDPFSGIFDRDNPEISPPPFDLVEDFLDAVGRHILSRGAELLHAGHVRKGRARPEVRDLLRPLQRQRRRHDFPVDRADGVGGKRAGIELRQPLDDGGLPSRGVEVGLRILGLLNLADLDDALGSFIE